MTRRELAIHRAATLAAVKAYFDELERMLAPTVVVRPPSNDDASEVSDTDRALARKIRAARPPR